jgi:hypothetical protein
LRELGGESLMSRSVHTSSSALLVALFCVLGTATARASATIVIDDSDPAGQGLNDPTSFVPVGGNPATTLGAARLGVFQQAASLWGATLTSHVPIHVDTQFVTLTCSVTSSVLASTGANTVHRNFVRAPIADTWYPQALANSLAGADLDPMTADISTAFNSALGGAGCMPGTTWYLGFDGHPGAGQIDMLTVVLHELSHGLGFQTYEDLSTGAELLGFADVFTLGIRQLNATPPALSEMSDAQRAAADVSDPNLYWAGANVDAAASSFSAGLAGGHVRLYAPSAIQEGSSVSHYSIALTPNELMEPVYTGPNHDLTLTADLLRDLGWSSIASAPAVPALPGTTRWLLGLVLVGSAARRLRSATARPRSGLSRAGDRAHARSVGNVAGVSDRLVALVAFDIAQPFSKSLRIDPQLLCGLAAMAPRLCKSPCGIEALDLSQRDDVAMKGETAVLSTVVDQVGDVIHADLGRLPEQH